MRVHLWTRPDKGHELIVVPADHHEGHGKRYVPTHRLAAVAWGLLDGLDDPREIDHLSGVGWVNAEGELEAVEADEHARRTRERTEERRASA